MGIILQPIPPQDPRTRRAGVQYFEALGTGDCDPANWMRATGLDSNGNVIWEPAPYVPDPLQCPGGDPLACVEDKEPNANILQFQDVDLIGEDTRLAITWNTSPAGAGITPTIARLVYRGWTITHDPTYLDSPKQTAFLDGSMVTVDTLIPNNIYMLLLRPETDTEYGYWEAYFGLTKDGWTTIGEPLVMHNAQYVIHEGEFVVHNP